MDKPSAIVVTILCLSALEIIFLLTFAVPDLSDAVPMHGHRGWTLFVGFVLIPTIAALISRYVHGNGHWLKRLFVFLVLPLGTVVSLLAISWVGDNFRVHGIELFVSIVLLLGGFFVLPIALWIRTRRTSFELDVNEWERERESDKSRLDGRKRRRTLRVALWIPSCLVLLTFLFLPELYGTASHLVHPTSRRFGQYDVSIPMSWVIIGPTEDGSALYGLIGTGMGRHPSWYRYKHLPLGIVPMSSWVLRHGNEQELSRRGEASGTRNVGVGGAQLTCVTYPLRFLFWSWVHIQCSGQAGLSAEFTGEPNHVPEFYDTVGNLKKIE